MYDTIEKHMDKMDCEFTEAELLELAKRNGYQLDKNQLSGSEAVYGFCGWLTSRKETTIMSSKHDASCIAVLIEEFCKVNELTEPQHGWEKILKHPK